MNQETQVGFQTAAGVTCGPKLEESIPFGRATYHFEAFNAEGIPLWEEEIKNLVTTVGRNDVLQQYFKGSGYTASWFVGLKGTGTESVNDTMANHPTWPEIVAYSQATRPSLTLGTVSGGSVDNTAARATFSINASATIAGGFVTNSSTKGGTTGILYSVGNFSASRTLAAGDSLQVTITLTAA